MATIPQKSLSEHFRKRENERRDALPGMIATSYRRSAPKAFYKKWVIEKLLADAIRISIPQIEREFETIVKRQTSKFERRLSKEIVSSVFANMGL